MSGEQKTLERTVVLVGYVNRYGGEALREIFGAYGDMLVEMVAYAVRNKSSVETLHSMFYQRYRERYPWLPTRVIKGCYRDAARRAKSFRELKRRGEAKTNMPEVKNITLTISDDQDWRLEDGVIRLRTHRGWIEIHYRSNRHLYRYLYGGWRISRELKLKLSGRKVLIYLTFTKDVEVSYDPNNVVAVDVNEDNVTIAVFRDRSLREIYRVETNLGRIAIAYSERRKRITKGKSTKNREVRKALSRLREKERKRDAILKTADIIGDLALKNSAVVVIGNVHRGKKKLAGKQRSKRMRHRIHQWGVSMLVEALNNKPVHVVEVSEAHSSSRNPFNGRRVRRYALSMIRAAVRGSKRVKVIKIRLRIAKTRDRITLERDVVGAINIGLKYLGLKLLSDGSPVALGSTEPHELRVKLLTPQGGLTPLTVFLIIFNSVSGETHALPAIYIAM